LPDLTPDELACYTAMLEHAKTLVYADRNELSTDAGLSDGETFRAIKGLHRKGLIR
jgi:hypothetical protein